MLPQPSAATQQLDHENSQQASRVHSENASRIGVGIDTSRYGHYAAFLRHDLTPAAGELQFVESAAGYAHLRARFEQLAARHGQVHFHIRLDAAGQYADNLLHFLHALSQRPQEPATPLAQAAFTISCGDPQRNKNYLAALYGSKKSDPVEARAAARFALNEQPGHAAPRDNALRTLRQVAGRLQATVRQRPRIINQFHHLLGLTFPELGLIVKDVSLGWVLELCHRYPTAQALAKANTDDLGTISITGIGDVTAAVLTAFILDVDRFETANKLVAYFGAMPIEVGSGVDRDGTARSVKRYVMSRRGNDLVRRYLWMAGMSAIRFNPAVRALYARVVKKHPEKKAIAVGHAMRKLLHLVFAVWKTKKPFAKTITPGARRPTSSRNPR